jgi:hypothetical protein
VRSRQPPQRAVWVSVERRVREGSTAKLLCVDYAARPPARAHDCGAERDGAPRRTTGGAEVAQRQAHAPEAGRHVDGEDAEVGAPLVVLRWPSGRLMPPKPGVTWMAKMLRWAHHWWC